MGGFVWTGRRSLGAVFVSLGTVLLLVAGLLVLIEPPSAQAAADPLLTVTKVVDNTGGGTAGIGDFTLTVTPNAGGAGTNVTSGVQSSFSSGFHTVSESGPSGYVLTFSGDCDSSGVVNLTPNSTKSCTLTNTYDDGGGTTPTTDARGHYPIAVCHAVPVGGSGINSWIFLVVDDDGADEPVGHGSTTHPKDVILGPQEFGPYDVDDCPDLAESATITLVKEFDRPAGLTATQADFEPTGFTGAVWGDNAVDVPAGPFTIGETDLGTETDPGSYAVTSIVCDGGPTRGTAAIGSLSDGDEVTCTITNTYTAAPVVTLVKEFVDRPGLSTTTQDDFEPTGFTGAAWGANVLADGDGPFTIGETDLGTETDPGSYAVTSIVCDGGPTRGTAAIGELSDGDDVTCTITNTYTPADPTVTFIKEFDIGNPAGLDAGQGDFAPTVDGTQTTWGQHTYSTGDGPFVIGEDDLGTHTDPGSYAAAVDCSGDNASGASTGELVDGGAVTCTITNTYVPPDRATLTVTKAVINTGGGAADVDDFTLLIDTDEVTSGVANFVDAGDYTVSETDGPGEYVGVIGGDCDPDGSITVEWGESYTCLIVNTFTPPTLTLTKIVIGDGDPDDFDLTATSSGGITTAMLSGVAQVLGLGQYTAAEANLAGYAPGDWSGDCDASGAVVLATPGADYQCTITNVSTTTTTLVAGPSGGTTTTTSAAAGGGSTTTTVVAGADLPLTGPGDAFPGLLAGLGLLLLGIGFVLLAPRRSGWVAP